jgi:hypothetical protein
VLATPTWTRGGNPEEGHILYSIDVYSSAVYRGHSSSPARRARLGSAQLDEPFSLLVPADSAGITPRGRLVVAVGRIWSVWSSRRRVEGICRAVDQELVHALAAEDLGIKAICKQAAVVSTCPIARATP